MNSSPWNGTEPTEQLLDKLKNVTPELEQIQREICGQLSHADGTPRKDRAGSNVASMEELRRFRAAVDQLRRVLWFYMDDPQPLAGSEALEQSAVSPHKTALAELNPPPSFFERLNLVIEGYMQSSVPPVPYNKRAKS